jgi:hypothetical protein
MRWPACRARAARGHHGWRDWDGAAAGDAPALGGRPGPSTEYRGPKGAPPGRLRRDRTHRFDAAMVRQSGGSVR